MFTGIIEAVGAVRSLADGVLWVQAPEGFDRDPIALGESVAVNGCCLTVVEATGGALRFDLSPETLARASLGGLAPGSRTNLERAMRADGRFGGHLVQGHVDAAGTLDAAREEGNSVVLTFRGPAEYDRYLIDKGSVAVEGVSLTVVQPQGGAFDVWVIPHTLAHTNLGSLVPGARVNLEYDVLAKHVEKLLAFR